MYGTQYIDYVYITINNILFKKGISSYDIINNPDFVLTVFFKSNQFLDT